MSSAKAALESDTRVRFSSSILSFCGAGTVHSQFSPRRIIILVGTCF